MKDFGLDGFLKYLAENGIELTTGGFVAIGVFLFLVVIYLVRNYWRAGDQAAPKPDLGTSAMQAEAEAEAAPEPVVAATTPKAAPKPAMVATAAAPSAAQRTLGEAALFAHVPEDSVLRRHFLTQVRHMLQTVAAPAPSDSVLRRHHEQLILSEFKACLRDPARIDKLRGDYAARRAAKAAEAQALSPSMPAAAPISAAAVIAPPGAWIPEDSVLRRHYLAHVRHMLEALAAPRPRDSVLRRHHEQLIQSGFQACLRDPARMDKLRSDYEACRAARAAQVRSAVQAAVASAPPVAKAAEAAPRSAWIPEDSILRRHFLAQVRHMLRAVVFPRPTDSVLCRHYEHLILSEFRACLGDQARMDRLLADYAARRAM